MGNGGIRGRGGGGGRSRRRSDSRERGRKGVSRVAIKTGSSTCLLFQLV